MAILLQADVWVHQDGSFSIPPFNVAIVRFTNNSDPDSFLPYHVDWYYPGEIKFRAAQVYKYYDRVRANPTYAVITVRDWNECSDYHIITPLPEKRIWKTMIDWQETIAFLASELRSKWPVKLAGYDGPFTSS